MSDYTRFQPGQVYIMRGITYSGKTSLARTLTELAGLNGKIHSTNDYFTDERGNYNFDPTKLPEFHAKNLEAFEESLQRGLDVVVCDNCNIRHWQYAKYVELAKKYGYHVAIIVMPHPSVEEAVARNRHNVPRHAIERMIRDWEP